MSSTYGRIDIHEDAPIGIRTALIAANLFTAADKGDNVNLVMYLSEYFDSNVMDAKRRGEEEMAEQYALDCCDEAVQHLKDRLGSLDLLRAGISEYRTLACEAGEEKERNPEGLLRLVFPDVILTRMDMLEEIVNNAANA